MTELTKIETFEAALKARTAAMVTRVI